MKKRTGGNGYLLKRGFKVKIPENRRFSLMCGRQMLTKNLFFL